MNYVLGGQNYGGKNRGKIMEARTEISYAQDLKSVTGIYGRAIDYTSIIVYNKRITDKYQGGVIRIVPPTPKSKL